MKLFINHSSKVLLILFTALFISGCTEDFESINTNPNAPVTVTADLLLSSVERDMMNTLLGETWGIGNIVIQHTAKNQFVNEDRYLWGERNAIWNGVYNKLRDVQAMIALAEKSDDNNYKGVGLVLRAWMFSLVTDAYGDVPYMDALKAKTDGIYYPKYDAQETIYTGILSDLSEANDLLNNATNIKGDVIYGGDVAKWRKLANSLTLRYLMRISDRKSVGPDMMKILNDPAAYPIFQGSEDYWNKDNAVYTFLANAPDQFPLFSTRIGSFNEFRASKTLTDKLISLNDSRLKIFFRPTPATESTPETNDDKYVGIPNGMGDVEALEYNGGPQHQSRIGVLFYEQANTDAGRKIAKGVIMTYAELQFILAEAREKNLISTGDAESYYTNGIKASFQFYGLTPGSDYFNQENVAYSGTSSEKLEKTATQKWISLFFQGMEAWFDWKRTGIPALQSSVTNQNGNKIPVRFIYPIIEQSLNSESRAAAVSRQGADDINTKVWWDMK